MAKETERLIGEIHSDVRNIYKKLNGLCRTIEKHEGRIDKLESFRDKIVAIVSILSLIIGVALGSLI